MNKSLSKKYILIYISINLFCMCIIISCQDKKEYVTKKINYDNKYNVYEINDSTFYIDYFNEKNNLSKRVNYKLDDNRELLRDGEYIEFYPKNKIEIKGHYKNNLRQGYWYYYSEKGNLIKIEEYINDSIFNFGELLNQIIIFDSNSNINERELSNSHKIDIIQDSIYQTEPFIFTVSLPYPKLKQGMYITIGDYDEFYKLKIGGNIDTLKTDKFEKTVLIRDHKLGWNKVKGIIINYDSIDKKIIPHFFSINYYVKKI